MLAMKLVILVTFGVMVLAGPVKRATDKCATECSGTSSKFRYEIGKSYNYQYETEAKVQIAGMAKNEAVVKIESNVQISAISPCEYTLKLSQIKITGPTTADLGSDWTQELGKYVTRFSFDDGEIGEICPKDDEPTWSVNIKRAILSAFQNAQTGRSDTIETYEDDISGRCPTKFEIKDEVDSKIITKTKNLVSCFNRAGNNTAIRMIPYEVRSAIQSSPILDSKQTCKQTIRRGILQDTSCDEKHIVKRANNGEKGGIIATATQKLHFLNENGNVANGDAGHPEKLYFDHKEIEHADSKQALGDGRQNLKDLCKTSKDEVRPETPNLFNELVYNLRKLSLADLKTLHQEATQSSECEFGKQSFLNALPMCGDTACITLVADVLKNNIDQLTMIQKRVYFTSFALISHVNKQMVVAVTPLIETVPKEGLLGISTLVHTYCRDHPSCGDEAEIKTVVQKLTTILGDKCTAANEDARDGIIYALKALGNIGHTTENVDKRVNCLKEKSNPVDIRLAAVQSLRRVPCAARVAPLKERFADAEEDVEIRLSSFLTFMQCVTPEIVDSVKEILEKEQIHQVGSFVRTYFEQIGSSSDPCKQRIQNLLASQYISKRFNSDPRKYSRFYETSQFSSQWNIGGHAESALIFNNDGYLPRQGFLNLTVDAFGSSINLLEIGGRAAGTEKLLDNLFGPNGYFTNPTAFYFKEQPKPHKNPKVVELQEKYGKNIKKNAGLDLSWYVRIFGDEIASKDVRNVDVMNRYTKAMEKIMSGLKNKQEVDVNLARANQLINHYFSFPTLSGLPLHIGANVTVALKVDFKGKLDLSRLMKEKNAELHADLKPSAAIERQIIFAIHAGNSKFGVLSQERLHSSTAANFHVELKNGETFKSSLELPKQKNEILQFDLKFFTIKNNVPIEEPGITKDRVSGQLCSPERLNKWIGFKICHEASFANASSAPDAPYFPLTGPVRYAAILEKTDANLKSYEFTATWKTTPNTKTAQLSFNTPGSSVDREITIDYEYQRGKSLNLNFRSPLKKINAVGTLEMAGQKQNGKINIKVDDSKEYVLVGSQEKQTTPNGGRTSKYNGEITRPGQQPITITAVDNFELPQSGFFKRTFDLNAVNLFETPLEFKSAVERTGQRQGKIDFTLKSPKLNSKVSGTVTLDGSVRTVFRLPEGTAKHVFVWNIEYQRPNIDTEAHKLDAKYELDYSRQANSFKFVEVLQMKCSRFPQYNTDYKLNLEKSTDQLDLNSQFKYGNNKDISFVISSKRSSDNKHTGTANLKSTAFGLDNKAEFTYQNNLPNLFSANVNLDTTQLKDIKIEAKYSRPSAQKVEGEAKLTYPGRDIRIFKKLESTGSNTHKSQAVLQWQKDKQIQLDSDLTFDQRTNDYQLKTVAKGVDGQEWTLEKKVKINDDMTVKSSALLQKGTQTVYDWQLNLSKDSPKKQKLHASLRSDYGNQKIDIATDGFVEELGNGRKINFVSKKDQKDFLKGELIIPVNIGGRLDSNKQVKVDLTWDKNTVFVDYQLSLPKQDEIQTDVTLKLDLPQYGHVINRKLGLKISKGDVKAVNLTLSKDNNPLLETSIGMVGKLGDGPVVSQIGKEGAVDFVLKTFEPWTKRHMAGLATHVITDTRFDFTLNAENIQEKRRFGIRLGSSRDGQSKRTFESEFNFNERQLKTKHTYERNDAESLRKVNGEIEFAGLAMMTDQRADTKPQKIIHEWSVKTQPGIRLTSKLQTPFTQLNHFDGVVEYSREGRKFQKNIDLKWNQNEKFKIDAKGDVSGDYTNIDGSLQSTIAGLKSGKLTLKRDIRTGRDFEAKLEWNDASKIHSYHKRTSQPTGDEKWSTGFEATIPNTANHKASANVDWNANTGKYKANTEAQLNGNGAYKVSADFDANSKEGTVDITTPTEQLKSAKAQVTKVGDNEYELKMAQNSQSTADIKATIKLEQSKQKLAVEVRNIQRPFKTQFEHEMTQTHFLISGELNTDLNDPKKTYGVKLITDRPNDNSRDVQVSLSYPGRQLRLKHQRTNQLPSKFDWGVEIQSTADKPGTKIQLNYDKPNDNQCKFGLHVTKDQYPGFHIEGTVDRTGVCRFFERQQCHINADVSLKYSADSNKLLTHKIKLNRDIIDQRPKYSYEWQTQHASTNLQVKHYGTLLLANCPNGNGECKRTVEGGLEFLDKQKQNQVYKYKFETDSTQTASSEFTCPSGKTSKKVQFTGEQLTVTVKRDNKDTYELFAGYDRPDKEFKVELKDTTTSEVIIHAGAKKPSPDSVELQLWHSQNKQKVEDISIITSLTEASRARSRLYVRPGFRNEFGTYLTGQWNQIQQNFQKGPAEGNVLAQLQESRQALREDVRTSLKPMLDDWQQQQDALGKELGVNFGGLRDLVVNYVNALREMKHLLQSYLNELVTRFTSSAPSRTLQELRQSVEQYVPQEIEKIKRLIDAISASAMQLYDQASGVAENWRKTRDDIYKNLRIDELITYLKGTLEDLRQTPIIQKIIEFFTSLRANSPDMSWERVKATAANLNEQANQAATETRKQVEDSAAAWRDELLKNDDTKEIAKFVQEAYNRLVWHLSRVGPSDKAKGFYEWITKEFRDMSSGGGIAKQFMPSMKDTDSSKGIYVIETPLPAEFQSLDEIANKFQIDRLRQMKNTFTARVGTMAQDADFAIRDALVNVHPSSVGVAFRSPFSSTAILAGDQHFVTFDDEEFDFAGECDYLLARDFENGEFNIFVTFEKRQNRVARKSLTIEYLRNKIEISHDNKVKVNDKDTELPWHSVNEETQDIDLQVFRRDHSVVVKAIDGLIVECDGHYSVCRFTVPRRYHGKSGGLLGTNDFEPSNELTKPDHKRTTNVAEFAKEWSTSANCAIKDNQAKQETITSGPLFEECNQLLNSTSSTLRLCFHRVPPTPFLTMCLTDAIHATSQGGDVNRQKQGLCNTTVAYIEACEEHGVALDLPSQCVQCDVAGQKLTEDETKRIEGAQIPNYADVIFIVEERKAMTWTKAQLPTIAQKIESDLRQQRYEVRFGVVGFNGDGVHYEPHFHTGQGSLSMTLDGLRIAGGQLAFSERERRRFQDPLVAVQFAASHFPFRAGARKLLALFACEECGGLQVNYFDLQSELLQMEIGLQVITTEKIELSSPTSPEIVAFDASTMYGADSSEKPDLRAQLVEPHDSCTVLAQETNGTVFSYSEKNLPAITQLLTQKLVKSVSGSRCQICECQEHDHAPRTVCFPCEMPRPASLTGDNTGFFNNPFVRLQKWQKKAQDTLNLPMRYRY